mmetsp:Transcript_73509/g.219428  ORF Transcript_73509/g.219428 Transcript_73509/m.219428 type:complete len:84 (+) Transcript_73509:150-401(+)
MRHMEAPAAPPMEAMEAQATPPLEAQATPLTEGQAMLLTAAELRMEAQQARMGAVQSLGPQVALRAVAEAAMVVAIPRWAPVE